MVGAMGGGAVFSGLTKGVMPYWMGALIICGIVGVYVVFGGMRGTAWTNVLQTFVFLTGAIITLIF